MDADKALPTVHINSSTEDTDHKKKRFTVYKVMVSNGVQSWFVFRRYAEFDKLYNALKKQYPNMSLKIPAKRIFGNNFDPDFIKQRREGLDDFIQKLVSTPELYQNPDVQDFLKMDNPRNKPGFNDVGIHSDWNSGSEQINLGPSGNPLAKPSDFNFLNVLGKGSFGKVLLARHKVDMKFYAVKVLQKSVILQRNEQRHVMAERNVLLKNCNHPFLVALHYSFQTTDKLYFVLDYVNGGELFFHLQRERTFPEHRARFYAAEIASAIGYLHSLNIIYRDLKPENILLDSEGHIKLTDFGLCKEGMESTETTTTFCGTPEYLAPEILRKEPYDRTVDWWCLGSVLYEMLFGLPPFYCRDVPTMYDDILHKPLLLRPTASPAAQNILEGLLQKDKHHRLGSYGDFKDIKRHIFFNSIDWEILDAKKVQPPFNPKVLLSRDSRVDGERAIDAAVPREQLFEAIIVHQADGPNDLRHFDPEFTEECVTASISQPVRVSVNIIEADDAFLGFSYVPPSNSFL